MEINVSIRKVRGYFKFVQRSTARSLKKHEQEFAKFNVQQMEVGLKSDGKEQEPYSDASVEYYGKEPGPIKLKKTGKFHQSVLSKTKAKDNVLTFEGTDNYELERHYGPIFGLTDPNEKKVAEILSKELIADIKKYFT